MQEKIILEDLMDNNVGIIIRVKNEEQYIGFAIQSVIDFLPNSKILIIDNNSTDDSLEIARLFNDRISINIINIDDYTPGKALNLGFEYFRKNYKNINRILVLSAHCQITKFCLADVEIFFNEYQNSLAIFGNQEPIYKGKKISKRYIWSHFDEDYKKNMFSEIENRYFLHNAFCLYKINATEICPFDEILSGKEDRYWAKEIVNKGYDFVYSLQFTVNHFYTDNGATWKGIG